MLTVAVTSRVVNSRITCHRKANLDSRAVDPCCEQSHQVSS